MSPRGRLRFIERCFIADVAERRLPGPLRRPLQSALVAAQQLCFMGYYGDPRTGKESGYVPFTQRPEYPEAMKRVKPNRKGLSVRSPREVDSERMSADVVVVGSGAAGAIVAKGLIERGRSVLMLERGRHIDPSQFEEDELKQFARMYADGAFQLSRDARFQVLQGRCVGGTTVVNNAVCLRIPDEVLERWNDPSGLNAGIPRSALHAAYDALDLDLPVNQMTEQDRLNPGAAKFVEGVKALGLDASPGKLEAGQGQHRRLPRLRLLQLRLRLRQEALDARHRAPGPPGASTAPTACGSSPSAGSTASSAATAPSPT